MLEVSISGTLSTVFQTRNKFFQSIYSPSVKFIQCQTVLRIVLKSSPNESINELWKSTSTHTNIQYDVYNSTKDVLKDFRSGHEDKLLNQLTCQGSFFSSVTKFSLSQLNKVWSTAQSKLPTTLFRHARTLANRECSLCLRPETLLHVVAGCQSYLDRFTWRHNSILNFLAMNDILALSETWLNSTVTNAEAEIKDYKLTRLDRIGKTVGGVCVYTSSSIKTRFLKDITETSELGSHPLWIQIQLRNLDQYLFV